MSAEYSTNTPDAAGYEADISDLEDEQPPIVFSVQDLHKCLENIDNLENLADIAPLKALRDHPITPEIKRADFNEKILQIIHIQIFDIEEREKKSFTSFEEIAHYCPDIADVIDALEYKRDEVILRDIYELYPRASQIETRDATFYSYDEY